MKQLLFIIVFILFSFGCQDRDVPEPEVHNPENIIDPIQMEHELKDPTV